MLSLPSTSVAWSSAYMRLNSSACRLPSHSCRVLSGSGSSAGVRSVFFWPLRRSKFRDLICPSEDAFVFVLPVAVS